MAAGLRGNWAAALLGLGAAAVVFAAVAALNHFDREQAQAQRRSEVTLVAANVRARLEQELSAATHLALGLVAYVTVRARIDQPELDRIAATILAQGRHVRNLAIAPDDVIAYVYPLRGNEKAVGLRYADTPAQFTAVQRARQTGKPVIAGPVALAQGGTGVISRVPVFAAPRAGAPAQYWGVVSVVLDVDAVFRAAGVASSFAGIRFALRGRDGQGEKGEVFFGSAGMFEEDAVLLGISLAEGANWQLAATPAEGWSTVDGAQARAVRLAFGALLALALGVLVALWVHSKSTLERRVQERTAALRKAMDQVVQSEKLASLGSLVAGIAHELNTPIGNALAVAGALKNEVELLERESGGAELRRSVLRSHVARMREAAQMLESNLFRSGELISGFKQVAVDQASARRRRFKLREVAEEIALTLRPTFKHTPYRLELEVPEAIQLDSYPGPLGQVLTNLIGNAIVHGFDGRPQGRIRLEAAPLPGDAVRLTVNDDGKGMDADTLKRAFDPFFTTRIASGGSGLGLYIAYNLVHGVLGGTIEGQSKPGAGTTFVLTLPLHAPQAQGEATQVLDA